MAPPAIGQQLRQLLSAPCTCFDRIHGALGVVPPASSPHVAAFHGWRAASLRNARLSLGLPAASRGAGSGPDILFISRPTSTRRVTNEAEELGVFEAAQRVAAKNGIQLPSGPSRAPLDATQVAREDAREVTLHVALAEDFSESGKLTATYSFENTTHKCRDRDFVAVFARRKCERLRGESPNPKGVRCVHVPKDVDDYLDFNWVD